MCVRLYVLCKEGWDYCKELIWWLFFIFVFVLEIVVDQVGILIFFGEKYEIEFVIYYFILFFYSEFVWMVCFFIVDYFLYIKGLKW